MKIHNKVIDMKQAVAALLQGLPKEGKQKLETENLKERWAGIMGDFVAKRTTRLYIKNNTLFLGFSSPALQENLSYQKTQMLEKVQKAEINVKRIFWY